MEKKKETEKIPQSTLRRRILCVVAAIVLVVGFGVMLYEVMTPKYKENTQIMGQTDDGYYQFQNLYQTVETTVTLEHDDLNAIHLYLKAFEQKFGKAEMEVELQDVASGQIILQNIIRLDSLKMNASDLYSVVIPCKQKGLKDKQLKLVVSATKLPQSVCLVTTKNAYKRSMVNGVERAVVPMGGFTYLTKTHDVVTPVVLYLLVAAVCVLILLHVFPYRKTEDAFVECPQPILNKKKRIQIFAGMLVVFVFAGLFVYFDKVSDYIHKPEEFAMTRGIKNVKKTLGNDYQVLTQVFTCTENAFSGILMPIDEEGYYDKTHRIEVQIKCGEDILLDQKGTLEDFLSTDQTGQISIRMDLSKPVQDSKDKQIQVILKSDDEGDACSFYVDKAVSGSQISFADKVNASKTRCLAMSALYQCNAFLMTYFIIWAVILLAFMMMMYLLIIRKGAAVHRIYAAAGICIGVLMCMMITLYGVPDEQTHADTAYTYSNKLMRIPETGIDGMIYKRGDDVEKEIKNSKNVNVDSLRHFCETLFQMSDNRPLVIAPANDASANANFVMYAPAALGITIGRLTGIGSTATFMLGRLFSLLFCVGCITLAIRKIPAGKWLLCIIGLFPMVMQEAASLSYDSVILGLAFLFSAYLWKILYQITRSEGDPAGQEWAVLIFTAAMIGSCKGGVYLPLTMMLLLLAIAGKGKKGHIGYPLLGAGFTALLFLCNNASRLNQIFNRQVASGGASSNNYYNMGYLLSHPGKTVFLFWNTIKTWSGRYLSDMVGRRLSWMTRPYISYFLVILFFALLIVVLGVWKRKQRIFSVKTWMPALILAIGSVFLIMLSMLVSTTKMGYSIIIGVQGRYFLPVLLAVLPAFACAGQKEKDKRYTWIGTGLALLSMVCVVQILRTIL